MVKVSFASIFFLLSSLSSLSFTFPIKPRTVSELETDLNKLSVDVAELASSVNAVVSVPDVVDVTVALVHVGRVEVDLVKCNADTSGIPPRSLSVDEASAIIEIAKGIVPNFEAALSAIVEQKNVDLVPIVPGPLAYSILEILDESTINLANSLIELVPSDDSDRVKEANCIKDRLQAAFDAARDAYASDY